MRSNVLVDGLVEFTPSQIEERASVFLRARVDVPKTLPIAVELLLENSKDVVLHMTDGLRDEHNVEGCVCNEFFSKLLTVYVDSSIADGPDDAWYNAVLAEELAHIELHRPLIQQIESIEDFQKVRLHPQWKRIELDALRFSLAIRIPVYTIAHEAEEAYVAVRREYGCTDPNRTALQVRNWLAGRYAVPFQDMHRRLSQFPMAGIYDCIRTSTFARSDKLLSIRELDSLRPIMHQQTLFGSNPL
jgi:hypothetical protein